ncbi:MAG: GNAT family N-acetyltransferase [Elainella sp.]
MAVYQFRPALPRDRRQIRLLLRWFERTDLRLGSTDSKFWLSRLATPLPNKLSLGRWLGLGLLLGLLLHGLWSWGGLPLLVCGLLMGGTVALVGWLNLYLFADWQNYWVVESPQGLIACGKLTHRETYGILADVVVSPGWRRQGVGSFLVGSIVNQATQMVRSDLQDSNPQQFNLQAVNLQAGQPIYLACLPQLMPFYGQFGFRPVELGQLSLALRQGLGLRSQSGLRSMVLVIPPRQNWPAWS